MRWQSSLNMKSLNCSIIIIINETSYINHNSYKKDMYVYEFFSEIYLNSIMYLLIYISWNGRSSVHVKYLSSCVNSFRMQKTIVDLNIKVFILMRKKSFCQHCKYEEYLRSYIPSLSFYHPCFYRAIKHVNLKNSN